MLPTCWHTHYLRNCCDLVIESNLEAHIITVHGWNVMLSCLRLLYQASYVSCDEYDNQILPGQLLFALKRLLSSGSCLTATVAT